MGDDYIPFHRPSIGPEERAAVDSVLAHGWLTTGPATQDFERAFAGYVGVEHAVAVNSATAALHLAMNGLGVRGGSEVIVPTFTFAASAEVVLYQGARPVLVDVDDRTLNISASAVEEAISPATAAVEVVHIAGHPADLPAISAAMSRGSGREGVGLPPIVEDAAHALPTRISALDGRFAGTVGSAGAYSFYATKTITTGEGGMLATNDASLADHARQMRLHGISRDGWSRYAESGSWFYEIEAAGFKYNLTDLAAALGLVQLARVELLWQSRADLASMYLERLRDLATNGRLTLPPQGTGREHAWHLFIVRLQPEVTGETDASLPGVAALPAALQPLATRRARAITTMKAAGVGASVHFIPLHLHPLYRRMGSRPGDLPVAERAYAGAISLPLWPGMTERHVDRVTDALRRALA